MNLDISGLQGLGDLKELAQEALNKAAQDLTAMTHAKIEELAAEKLHSRREMFMQGVSVHKEGNVNVIELDAKVDWIDSGLPAHNMLEDLLSSPKAKIAHDGSKYLVVPFKHNGPPNNVPASQQPITDALKAEFKKRKIPFQKIERDESGRPLLGKIHRFNIDHSPLKSGIGPGQGWGPVGDVRQGPNERQKVGGGPGGGGIPFLHGVNVYQRVGKGGKVQKDVLTFRLASSRQEGTGMWQYPGTGPTNIFESAYKWAEQELDKIVPMVLASIIDRV